MKPPVPTATTHTPGPWIVSDNALDPENTVLDGKRGKRVGRYQICVANGYSSDEATANARLIASAPDLLAALQNLEATAPGDIDAETAEEYRRFVWRVARAAIAKATEGAR
jgi:hypothetical protein